MSEKYVPTFAVGKYESISSAIESGKLKYPAYVYCNEENPRLIFINKNQEIEEILPKSYNSLDDIPIVNLTGTVDDIINISELSNGIYYISGYYRTVEEELVHITSTKIQFIIDSDFENKYITKFEPGDISLYIINEETGAVKTENYVHTLDDTPTEGSMNGITSDGVYQAIIGAMEKRY